MPSISYPNCVEFYGNHPRFPENVPVSPVNQGIVPPYISTAVARYDQLVQDGWTWWTQNMQEGCYTGEWSLVENGPQGFGSMIYSASSIFASYVGGWNRGHRQGYGCMRFKENPHGWLEYTGGWKEDQLQGLGTMKYQNGDSYEGGWNIGQRHGYAVYQYRSRRGVSVEYKGCFVKDEKWEGKITGMNEDETALEYFGRFDHDMFQDPCAWVKIGSHGEQRRYEQDQWIRGGDVMVDELDWLKGHSTYSY